VPDQLILVQRSMTGTGLGDEGILDPGGPQKVLRSSAEDFRHQ
jgi:hypothetical protein